MPTPAEITYLAALAKKRKETVDALVAAPSADSHRHADLKGQVQGLDFARDQFIETQKIDHDPDGDD
jgi:hypothetical protein